MMEEAISWVTVIGEEAACGELATAYDAVRGGDGGVENLYLAMSQTPRAIAPADAHYRAVLHNPDNPLEPWLAEMVATYVALLSGSRYVAVNHGENTCLLHGDRAAAERMLASLVDDSWEGSLEPPAAHAALVFTRKLTCTPGEMCHADVAALRLAGHDDKAISYIVQIAASFAYWARITNGLGIRPGATVGLAGRPAAAGWHPGQRR